MPSIDISQYQFNKKASKPRQSRSEKGINWRNLNRGELSLNRTGLSDKQKEALYMELGTLLNSGIDLRSAMDLIISDEDRKKERAVLSLIREDVVGGKSLSEAMQTSHCFSEYEYFSIRIGEETGKLNEVLRDLASYYKSKITQRRKVISAMSYPIIVLCTSLSAVLFMLKFVVPMFADVFQRFGSDIPWITSVILQFSGFLDKYFLLIVLLLIVCIGMSFVAKDQLWFRKATSRLILSIPVAGDLVKKIYLARFANTMRLLVSTNTPLLKSVTFVRRVVGFYPLESSLEGVEKSILMGESLHSSLEKFDIYPSKFIQLIKVGEEVNRLDYFFGQIAEQYTEEVEYKTTTLSNMMEPLIIILLGLVVGVILVSMYLPMFQMGNSFG